jgi:hypothetical protein
MLPSNILLLSVRVLGSTIAGAFSRINVNTTTATGSIAVRSYTPAVLQADLAGITTLLADLPAGGGNISAMMNAMPVCSGRLMGPLGSIRLICDEWSVVLVG